MSQMSMWRLVIHLRVLWVMEKAHLMVLNGTRTIGGFLLKRIIHHWVRLIPVVIKMLIGF